MRGLPDLFILLLLSLPAHAWILPKGVARWPALSSTAQEQHTSVLSSKDPTDVSTRRDVLATAASLSSMILLLQQQPACAAAPPPKEAAVFDKNISVEDAKKRFQLARNDVRYLYENFAEISGKGGGDAVRNYLGTQGVTSNMYGIQKVLRLLQEEADDIVEYTEAMNEFNAYFFQAEGAAYQSMFVEYSSAKSTPQSLLATAKKDIEIMMKYMDELAAQLNL